MRHIFLIGLSGSGKSTVGRLLERDLGMPLLDIDALIEEECGERIPTIFARHGEEYFRSCESRVLDRVTHTKNGAIISTGGGIVTRAENRALMAERGVRIYLQVEPVLALQRLQAQMELAIAQNTIFEVRPLLAGPDPLASLQHLLSARASWYQEAELVCSTLNKSARQVAKEIIAMLNSAGELETVAPIIRHIKTGDGYDAVVDWGGLGRLGDYLKQLQIPARIFLFTDSNL